MFNDDIRRTANTRTEHAAAACSMLWAEKACVHVAFVVGVVVAVAVAVVVNWLRPIHMYALLLCPFECALDMKCEDSNVSERKVDWRVRTRSGEICNGFCMRGTSIHSVLLRWQHFVGIGRRVEWTDGCWGWFLCGGEGVTTPHKLSRCCVCERTIAACA